MKHLLTFTPPSPAGRVLVAAAVVAACATPVAGDGESIVYYQLITTDNKIRDVSAVPRTNDRIRRVLRISRIEGPYPGHVIHTVTKSGFSLVQTGRTVRTELHWDGKAWVGQADRPGDQGDPKRRAEARKEAVKLLAVKVKAAKESLSVADKAVLAAAEGLAKAKGTDGEAAAMLLLAKAQQARRKALRALLQLEGLLASPTAPAASRMLGQAAAAKAVPAPTAGDAGMGVVQPIQSRRVLPYRSHVWKLPRRTGRRSYAVSMAHPEAGRYGSFYYVAYTDTDRDGTPDTLIARSPLAAADRPGQWTQWSFSTAAAGDVYVGSAWPHARSAPYHRPIPPGAAVNWRGLGTEVYVSGRPFGGPRRRWNAPYLTNLRVRVEEQP